MKILVLSDVHGNARTLQTALDSFEKECDLILMCGDYLNHGPRNPLTEGWEPKKVVEILKQRKNKITGVRGNCDAEVDEMLLTFPMMAPYANVFVEGKRIFAHHGHLYTKEQLLELVPEGSIVVSGHTHVTVLEKSDGLVWFNPGSMTLPKCDDGQTCGLIEVSDGGVVIKLCSIEGKVIRQMNF